MCIHVLALSAFAFTGILCLFFFGVSHVAVSVTWIMMTDWKCHSFEGYAILTMSRFEWAFKEGKKRTYCPCIDLLRISLHTNRLIILEHDSPKWSWKKPWQVKPLSRRVGWKSLLFVWNLGFHTLAWHADMWPPFITMWPFHLEYLSGTSLHFLWYINNVRTSMDLFPLLPSQTRSTLSIPAPSMGHKFSLNREHIWDPLLSNVFHSDNLGFMLEHSPISFALVGMSLITFHSIA